MPTLPTAVRKARQGLIEARLEIEVPKGGGSIPLRFNPSEYQIQKQNRFSEINIPGLETPPIQFVRGDCEKLTVECLADTSDTLKDVRTEYTNKLRELLDISADLHAPPIVLFVWDKNVFRGVLESLNITFVLFSPQGVPLRAKLNMTLKEYRPVEVQPQKNSHDVEKIYTVRRGDTLSSISASVFRDPFVWREIARANAIEDPRTLSPGTVLTLPRLDREN